MILMWESSVEGGVHQLEYATTADFAEVELWYEGPAQRSFVSGLGNGEHYYRVRTRVGEDGAWGPWSEPMHIVVELQSLSTAWLLFGVGAVMFVCIAGFIAWQTLRGESMEESEAGV